MLIWADLCDQWTICAMCARLIGRFSVRICAARGPPTPQNVGITPGSPVFAT